MNKGICTVLLFERDEKQLFGVLASERRIESTFRD